MNFQIFDTHLNTKNNAPIFEAENAFNLVPAKNRIISTIIKGIDNYSYTFIINDKRYELKDLFVAEVAIKRVCKLYFLFESDEQEEKIVEEISSLKKMPVSTDEEKNKKVEAVLEKMKAFKPLLVLSDQYYAFLNEDTFGKDTVVLMKNNPEDPEEKVYINKMNTIFNVIFYSFMPALILVLFYFTIDFFMQDKVGLGITLIFVVILDILVFGYGSILINGEDPHKSLLSKRKLVTYALNFASLLLGIGVAILFGLNLLKTGDISAVFAVTFICFGIALVISIINHIATFYLSKYVDKRRERKKKQKISL